VAALTAASIVFAEAAPVVHVTTEMYGQPKPPPPPPDPLHIFSKRGKAPARPKAPRRRKINLPKLKAPPRPPAPAGAPPRPF
jgi:hypothetical protein